MTEIPEHLRKRAEAARQRSADRVDGTSETRTNVQVAEALYDAARRRTIEAENAARTARNIENYRFEVWQQAYTPRARVVTASCGGEYCTEESHVCDYPPEGSFARLQQLMDEWNVATETAFDAQAMCPPGSPELATAFDREDEARRAWANQYRLIYNEDPDWSAIRDGCA